MKTRFAPPALRDLSAIARWIAADRPNASKVVVKKLRAICVALADHPHAYPFLPQREERGVRRAPYGRWAICYRVDAEGLFILRILDSAQDVASFF
uniref:type II toxin-antitoxin system RelE/ParE family toxin n=1 Tax=uncultured Caulobacter sp. TaxID=158749 RepID=UPI00345BDEE1